MAVGAGAWNNRWSRAAVLCLAMWCSPAPAQDGMDAAAWNLIRDAADPAVFERFIEQYPNSVHALDARSKLGVLTDEGGSLAAPAAPPPKVLSRPSTIIISATAAPLHECDVLAADVEAHIADVPGVAGGDASLSRAIPPCTLAVSAYPDEPRFYHQLARAYRQAGDMTKAMEWYEKAAAMDFAPALDHLGSILGRGIGVTPDVSRSQGYLQRAIAMNSVGAMATQGHILMTGTGMTADPAGGYAMFERSAAGGSPYAMRWLGIVHDSYFLDYGVAKNDGTAFGWYSAAIDGGDYDALHQLARLYGNGRGVRADAVTAAQLLLDALSRQQTAALDDLRANSSAYGRQTLIELQRLLKARGVYQGALDGDFGPASVAAAERVASSAN